jgi:hypothetical protein
MSNVMKTVSKVTKGGTNDFQNYKYVRHDDVIDALRKTMVDNGIFLETTVLEHSQEIGKTTTIDRNGKPQEKTSVFSTVMSQTSFVNIDDPKDRMVVQYPGTGIDNQDKGCGKAITSAYKTMLLKTFCLESSDDIEKEDMGFERTISSGVTGVPGVTIKITAEQAKTLRGYIQADPAPYLAEMKRVFNVDRIEDLTPNQYHGILDTLRTKQEKAA